METLQRKQINIILNKMDTIIEVLEYFLKTKYVVCVEDGGEGSGNFEHEGRPGEIGGSGEGGGLYNSSKKTIDIINKAYEEAKKIEPQITNDLKNICSSIGCKLTGLDFRLKTKESLLRKVNSDLINNPEGDAKSVVSRMFDIVRYTNISNAKNLTQDYFRCIEKLQERGYTLIRVKNTWLKKVPYKGINCVLKSPNGEQQFELQFHTKQSFDVKDTEMHKLYEEYRLDSTSESRRVEIENEMFKLSNNLEIPFNVGKISDYDETKVK